MILIIKRNICYAFNGRFGTSCLARQEMGLAVEKWEYVVALAWRSPPWPCPRHCRWPTCGRSNSGYSPCVRCYRILTRCLDRASSFTTNSQTAAKLVRAQDCQMAKFDPFLHMDCARLESRGGRGNTRKGRDQIVQRSAALVLQAQSAKRIQS